MEQNVNNILCMKWGTKFGPEYVNRLFRMVERNVTVPYRFVCFTDDSSGIDYRVETKSLPAFIELDKNAPERGWRKLSVLRASLGDLTGKALFLDLDIVIRSNIDCFFQKNGKFLIVKDWDFPNDIIGNSSVFRFEIGSLSDVLDEFERNSSEIFEKYRNEQAYLSYAVHRMGLLRYWDDGWCVSFKRNCLRNWPVCYFKTAIDPANAKIIVFHGKPTPDQAYKGYVGKYGFRYVKATKWLAKYW